MSILRADSIRDRAGTGAPDFPNGLTGNLTGTATTATTLSGTPNISVGTLGCGNVTSTGDVTGVNATFSGNLTVQGTTTTIDTAVTAVDSLAVDGNVGVGTTNPVTKLVVASSDSGHADMRFQNQTTGYATNNGFWVGINNNENALIYNYHNSDMMFATNSAERFRIDQHGTSKFKGPLTEKARYEGVTLNGDYNHDLITHGNVAWLDTAAGGAFALNLRGSATVALNDMMDTGESLSFWFAHACASNTAYYMNAFKIDGTTISGTNILWSGGSAPSSAGGGTGTKDVYAFTVFKTANATFRAFASVTNHG